jgi:DNA topoisomerase-6 subunit B
MIHMASVWVPFTSESKEAIADYDEIRKEMKLALMECGRKLGTYLRKRQKMQREAARRDVFERYIGEVSKAINAINGTDAKKLYEVLLSEARKRTAIADAQLDDEGKTIRKPKDEVEELKKDEGVVLVESRAAHLAEEQAEETTAAADQPDIVSLSKPRRSKRKPSKRDRDVQ